MVTLFNKVVYMSMLSTLAAVLIIFLRALIGSRLPKILSYAMWGILLFRLLVPISFSSAVSIFNLYPISAENITISLDTTIKDYTKQPIDRILNTDQVSDTSNMISQEFIINTWFITALILIGLCILFYYGTVKKLNEAIVYHPDDLLEEALKKEILKRKVRIFSLEELSTPVVCGILKPKIIVPAALITAKDKTVLKNVIKHEIVHIKRFDHLIKLIALMAACIHWFNPIIWIALSLAHKDMERSCDEKVIQLSDQDIKKEYASSLLHFSLEKGSLKSVGIVAFGESNMKKRIKGVLRYKKPNFLIKMVCIIILIGMGAFFISDASQKTIDIQLERVKEQQGENWTELDKVSPYVVSAAIASEDRNFNKHSGVDITRIAGAFINNVTKRGQLQGASTITQQLVKNVSLEDEPISLSRKRKEIYTALKLERNYNKDQIMEAYLNVIAFGHGIQGIGEAARTYYEKEPSDLSKEEAATLIAVIQAPTLYSPLLSPENNKNKADYIISMMKE
ncbi:transglycosylase domain-containing protein [Cellulosilyticum sp. I15G10I2]|uniref:transglycosylase domain-containing protein n=1 Tax=Cellulosilyticum sp. I15G10I2 TaxID=1892843 RepID=UPI00085C8F9A|nr:transglycosylase domain-containing protein [Cellulosilyticum sp. I15G10I2]